MYLELCVAATESAAPTVTKSCAMRNVSSLIEIIICIIRHVGSGKRALQKKTELNYSSCEIIRANICVRCVAPNKSRIRIQTQQHVCHTIGEPTVLKLSRVCCLYMLPLDIILIQETVSIVIVFAIHFMLIFRRQIYTKLLKKSFFKTKYRQICDENTNFESFLHSILPNCLLHSGVGNQ